MIDFRYHVVSIVAVFLALALGLFIGSTTLRGKVGTDIFNRAQSVAHQNGSLRGQLSDTKTRLTRSEAFDTALEPYAVQGQLAGESVVVVSAPGADSGIRSAVMTALTDAGATINGDVRLQDALVDPQQDAFLKTLADKVSLPNRSLSGGSGTQRALALLADVLVAKPQSAPVPAAAADKVLAAYSAGKLLSISGDQPRPAALAVVIAAAAPASTEPSTAVQQQSLLAQFARDLDRASVGAVAAGPASADDAGGLLDVVRRDKSLRTNVSTVDSVDLPSGVIATMFALAEQADGRAGSYGSGAGADAPLPSPAPTSP